MPESVHQEYKKHEGDIEPNVFSLKNIKQMSVESEKHEKFIREHKLEKLHMGETECLYLCKNLPIDVILTNDLAVRDTASELDITPVGSIGVIVKAYRENRLTFAHAEKYIFDLYEISSLFVTRAIVELV